MYNWELQHTGEGRTHYSIYTNSKIIFVENLFVPSHETIKFLVSKV